MYPNLNAISLFNIIDLASVPLSIISILVITPIVLVPSGSNYYAIYNDSEVDISALAGITHKIIVLSSLQYLLTISLVIYSIFFG